MIKNYIFDFGNVLTVFCPKKLTALYISNEKSIKEISDVVFDHKHWNKLDSGFITDDEIREIISSRVPCELKEIALKVYNDWIYNLTPINEMIEIVKDMKKKGKKLYLLSNISIGFAEVYESIKWIKELFLVFDGVVFSGPLKMAKPQKEIFEYTLDKYNLSAEESLFIDDKEENVKGAEDVGINGYLFDGNADKFKNYIDNL